MSKVTGVLTVTHISLSSLCTIAYGGFWGWLEEIGVGGSATCDFGDRTACTWDRIYYQQLLRDENISKNGNIVLKELNKVDCEHCRVMIDWALEERERHEGSNDQ